MMYKVLNLSLSFIIKRYSLMIINALVFFFSIYCLKALFLFLNSHSNASAELTEQMNDTLNGIAGILVALGVLMESRHTIRNMITNGNALESGFQHDLDTIAEHNGLGLLLIGLFMEIITAMIDIPNTIVDTSRIEFFLFYVCFFLIICSMVIEADLVKDYFKTYLKSYKK